MPSVSVIVKVESSTSTQSVPSHCINCPAVVPSANFGKVTAFAAISALVIPNGETLKVNSSPTIPVPSRVNVVFVAPITSLPIMPSVSVIVKVESSTSIQSIPSHCINCPAAAPSANFVKVIALSAIFKLVMASSARSFVTIVKS